MSVEFNISREVVVCDSYKEEYPNIELDGEIGEIIATIPPNSQKPNRVMVRFDKVSLLNLRLQDIKTVDRD